jgi:hypothetical protein
MTTTLIYEPIAHISDDYFWPPKGRRFHKQSRQHQPSGRYRNPKTGLNITDGTAIGWTATLPEANGKERNDVLNEPRTATTAYQTSA